MLIETNNGESLICLLFPLVDIDSTHSTKKSARYKAIDAKCKASESLGAMFLEIIGFMEMASKVKTAKILESALEIVVVFNFRRKLKFAVCASGDSFSLYGN